MSEPTNSRAIDEAAKDVLKDGTTLHFQHGFGQLAGELSHSGAFAGGEDDCFHEHQYSRYNSGALKRELPPRLK